jgi:GGDEF domain-containing protein
LSSLKNIMIIKGHQQGDVVLRKMAQTIKRNVSNYNGAIQSFL